MTFARSTLTGTLARLVGIGALATACSAAEPSARGASGSPDPAGTQDGNHGGAAGDATAAEAGEPSVADASATTDSGAAGDPPDASSAETALDAAPEQGFAELGSLVILGDSIGDGGGKGPYYYDLLREDLKKKYGAGLAYHRRAKGGSKTGALSGQIDSLPKALPGPVAVCITSGGNDMKEQLVPIIAGLDAPARTQMGNDISNALAKLLTPERFGAGVAVRVFQADIYDASDGQGNFAQHKCNFGSGFPALPTDGYFAAWNGAIGARVAQHQQVLVSIHTLFRLHGFNHPPSWYASDCTHPNSTGHDQLRRKFYLEITGQVLSP